MSQLAESIKTTAEHFATMGFDKTVFKLVAENGFEFKGSPLPDYIKQRTPKECFANALHLALETGLTYVEGYISVHAVPIHHAWCVDEHGTVIDPTVVNPEDREYFGIPMDIDFVMHHCLASGYYGILDNFEFREIYDIDPSTYIHPEWKDKKN